ncbi:DUF1993 domain-containing protein [Sorangium sp. So ce448]|uniref:DUF1993 domain-containing protein n=1 Tax=Sorangium sp. So ce448 TaxID=3133314 RepID=UPI003F627C3B
MTIALHSLTTGTFVPFLRNLSALFDKAAAQGHDGAALAQIRLAPDMLPLSMQVRFVCDQARFGVARLVGEEPPAVAEADADADLAGFKARIERTIAYVESVAADRYRGAETRTIAFPLTTDLSVEFTGEQFLRDFAFPNFYFHLVTAYDILRNQGVQIGKADYMAHIGYALRGTPPADGSGRQ